MRLRKGFPSIRTIALATLALALTAGIAFANWSPAQAATDDFTISDVTVAPATSNSSPLRVQLVGGGDYLKAAESTDEVLTLNEGDVIGFNVRVELPSQE